MIDTPALTTVENQLPFSEHICQVNLLCHLRDSVAEYVFRELGAGIVVYILGVVGGPPNVRF